MTDLEQDLETWDGKSSDDITAIFERHRNSPRFAEKTVALLRNEPAAVGASWLLKRFLEQGGSLNSRTCHDICRSTPALRHWAARLHVLQCLPFLDIQAEDRKTLEPFVRDGLSDDRAFVRAWSYNGLNELSMRFPDLQEETRLILEMAMRDEAPSVKARVRNILRKNP